MMKKILILIFLTSTILNSQNKELIKETIYSQSINNIDKIAQEDGYKANETICVRAFIKTDSNGEITEINISEKSQIFESELKSYIRQIPTLNPDEYLHKGNIMKYGLKMCFKLATKSERKKILKKGKKIGIKFKWFYVKEFFPVKKIDINESEIIPFSLIKDIPTTNECVSELDEQKLRQCVQSSITMHVNRKFDASLASDLGLNAGIQRITVKFVIDKYGEIVNITADGSRKELNEEAIRVINSIEKLNSGTHNGHYPKKCVSKKYEGFTF